ncbi:MAG: SdrD B-like domain-containing protein [Spirosomataceae bacterium]
MKLFLKNDEGYFFPPTDGTMKEVTLKQKRPITFPKVGLILIMLITSLAGYSQSGKVFRDGNGNGTKQAGERGIPGIQVNSYINNGLGDVLLGSAVSNDTGYYNLSPAAAAGQLIRIEFAIPANFCNLSNAIDYPALGGNNYGTNVQFVKGPAANVNFGIQNPAEYVTNPNPTLFVPCYVNGDPLASGTQVGSIDAFVSFSYNSYGVPGDPLPGGGTVPSPNKLATASQIGTTWGVAYSKQAKKVFTSAFLKRHSGMGPLGPGGIYIINPSGGVTNFFSFDALGFATNASGSYAATHPGFNGVVGSNSNRSLPTGKGDASRDRSAFDQVGKVSLGDIDISDDGQFLYAVNLFDRKLYQVDLKNAAAPQVPTAADVKAFDNSPWLTETCTNGVSRPFGMKYYRGKIYVGVVCTGEDVTIPASNLSKYADNLYARVYQLDIAGGTWSKVMDFKLDYQKGIVGQKDNTGIRGWYAWTDDFEDLKKPYYVNDVGFHGIAHPQPMLSDIEFDQDGSMILAFMDRMGHQVGNRNYSPVTTDNTFYYGIIGGDLLRAYKNPATCNWDLESNGKAGNIETAGKNNGQGIGGGEFYWGDGVYLFDEATLEWHSEATQGGMAINPSSGEVLVIAMDPVDNTVVGVGNGKAWSGGVARLSNTTGAKSAVGGYNLYTDTFNGGDVPQLGKVNGLGDVEITGEIPPIQIGNRVWKDLDEDGIQDSDEPGIDGVIIELCNAQGQKIAQTTTANGGQWYFRTFNSLLNTHPDSLLIETDYIVKIAASNYAGGAGIGPLAGLKLTKKDQIGNGLPDVSDNDADPTQPNAQIAFKTGDLGQSMYDLDFGVTCAVKPAITAIAATAATCNGITPQSNGKITATVTNTLKVAYNKGTGFTKNYAQATAFTGGDIIATLANPASAPGDSYYIRFYGADSSCFKDTIIVLPFTDCSCVKPVVTATPKNQSICEGSTIAAYTASTVPNTNITYKWYGPLTDTTGSLGTAVSGQTNAAFTPTAAFAGKRYFAVVATGIDPTCADTAFVSLTITPRPVANVTPEKQTICVGELPGTYTATPATGVTYAWYGALTDTTGSLGTAISGATSATFIPSGADITTVGTKYYAVVITTTQTLCKDTAFVRLIVNAKPNAGTDLTGGSAICNTVATVDLPDAAVGESWSQLGNTPKVVSINAATGVVTGMDAIGTYQFILKNTTTNCADTVSVEVKNCAKGSIGDFVWKDANDNGIQDLPSEKGVKGVIVQLLNATNNAVLATDTTDANGIYGFPNLDSGTYKVKIVLSSLPDTCQISPKQDVNTGGGNDTNDSDFNPTTGESQVVTINTLGTGIAKDNPTVDAALYVPCVKPAAGADVAVCQGVTTVDLKDAGTGEAWSKGAQPVGTNASINATTGVVTGLSSVGDYFFILTYKGQALCSDTVKVTVNAKPNAGTDINGINAICNTIATVDLPDAAVGESWSQLGTAPKAVTINATTGVVTGMDALGTYQFILKNTTTNCADTVSVEVKNCAKGSLGDFVWKDVNDNGIQDLPAEKGVKGVIVQLLNSNTNAFLATDTTDANGIYSFTGLDSGSYKVKIVLSSLPDTCQISSKQDVNTGGGTDANDSDFNPTTGESQVVTINTLGTGLAKDNPTIDAALVRPCIKPSWQVTTAPTCSPSAEVYSVSFSISNKNGTLKVNVGTLSGNNPYTVSNIPNGTNLIITDSLRANCVFDTTIVAPDCSCPQITLLTPNATACKGDTLPTLKIFLAGNTNGVGAEWYANLTGGTALGTGLSFKPSGTIAATDTFYIQLTGTTGACLDQPRTPVIVLAQDCEVDLALKKLINKKIAHIGDTLIYTIKVWNEFVNDASGVEVTDSIATTVGFIANSFVASRGSAVINGNVIKWTIGNIAANGDTVMLTYKVKATQQGIHFNVAEISKTNEKDRDSTPGNGKEEEDDLDRQCFTVPIKLCPGEKVEAMIPAKYTDIKWYKGGVELTALAGQNTVLLEDIGNYTFTATNNVCPAEGCCPLIIEPGDNCCPEELCVPFTIKRAKKKI